MPASLSMELLRPGAWQVLTIAVTLMLGLPDRADARPAPPAPSASQTSVPRARGHRAVDPLFTPERRALVLAGGIVGGTGLLLTALGFGVFGGIHAADPGKGLQLEGFGDSSRAQRMREVKLARAMQGLGFAGGTLAISGAVMLAVGLAPPRAAARRASARCKIRFAPGLASFSVIGRF